MVPGYYGFVCKTRFVIHFLVEDLRNSVTMLVKYMSGQGVRSETQTSAFSFSFKHVFCLFQKVSLIFRSAHQFLLFHGWSITHTPCWHGVCKKLPGRESCMLLLLVSDLFLLVEFQHLPALQDARLAARQWLSRFVPDISDFPR